MFKIIKKRKIQSTDMQKNYLTIAVVLLNSGFRKRKQCNRFWKTAQIEESNILKILEKAEENKI